MPDSMERYRNIPDHKGRSSMVMKVNRARYFIERIRELFVLDGFFGE